MKRLYTNSKLKKIIAWIVGASIGLSTNVDKGPYQSPIDTLAYSNTFITKSRSLEGLAGFPLVPINLSENQVMNIPENPGINEDSETRVQFIDNNEISDYIKKAYKKIRVPKHISQDFVESLIKLESSRNIYAQSSKGAKGLMQLLPEAWSEVDGSDFDKNCYNPGKNVEVGIKYLKWIDNYCRNNYPGWDKLTDIEKQKPIAAAYNCGIGQLEKGNWEIGRMPKETKSYVDSLRAPVDSLKIAQAYPDSTKAN